MGKKRILIVDDELDLIDLVSARLELHGYDVATAADGEEGLEKARALRPDLILLDVMMPKMNGYQVCQMLKGDAQCKSIPVILLTARGQEKDRDLGKEVGADGYVIKPFEAQELMEQIETLLH
jgi:adenylate cyclase